MSVSRRGQWNQCLLMTSRNIHFLPFREAMEQRNPKPLGGITLGLDRPGPRRLATVAPGLRTRSLRRHLRVMTRRPRRGQRPHAGRAFRPPEAGLQAPKGPGADPARMRATPTAFRLRVFPEPPPLFLGLRDTPLSISWRVPADRAGNLCPVISQKTMTGAPLDRRLYRRKQTPPQGARLPSGDQGGPGPHAGLGRPGRQEACGRCRISPTPFCSALPGGGKQFLSGNLPGAWETRELPSPQVPPATSPRFCIDLYSLRKMAAVKELVMDTLGSGQMLPVLRHSGKLRAETRTPSGLGVRGSRSPFLMAGSMVPQAEDNRVVGSE